jgi:hypothetical protein
MKDRLQEVPKGDKWSRRHLSFPGNFYQHLRDISALRQYSKRLQNPILKPTHGTTSFWVPLHFPLCSLSLLLYK